MNNIKTFENFNNQDIFKYIYKDDIQSVKNYIDSGYDLNIKEDEYDCTPLIYATKYKRVEIIKLLLNAGADTNIQNNVGDTALIIAAYDNIEIVKLLLSVGADINKQNKYGNTALIRVVSNNNNNEITELLLYAGSDIDKQNDEGETALICAAYNNNKENIELLLNYHADEFILNNYGGSFYDYLNIDNRKYFLKEYPNSVYNAIYHNYKKSFTEFIKDYNIKN